MTHTLKAAVPALLASALFLPIAAAQTQPAVTVTHVWSRATPPGANIAAAYMTLTSPANDALTAVSSPAAAAGQLHEMTMDGNIMRMREVREVALPAGKPVSLGPGGYHVMLTGLRNPLKKGQKIKLHLIFQHAASMDVEAKVAGLGATTPPG